ncbi:MAG: Crp/Fnr family transcriptional regulator [Bacteroidota bacterium]
MHDNLRSNIQKYLELPDDAFKYFVSLLELKQLRKKEVLLRQGDLEHFEAYIIEGCMIGYHLNGKKQKTVLYFMYEDWWVADIPGMIAKEPSYLTFEAIEDTRLLLISRKNKEKLYAHYPIFERLFRKMSMVALGAMQQRVIAALSQKADERYAALIEQYPKLEQRVPQYLIASYLGISAEFLSKVRRKVNRL